MTQKRTCPVCGDSFRGRRDKKFCSDQCRATFNNSRKKETEGYVNEINRILRKNRSILKSINPQGKSTVREDYLRLQGFNFRYFTTFYQTESRLTYFFCYEYGYLQIEGGKVLIINWQNYMDQFPNVIPKI